MRPSPTQSASSTPAGTVKKGNDGRRWIVKAVSRDVHRWVLLPQPAGRRYVTHFNGGRPFQVFVTPQAVEAYAIDPSFEADVYLKRVVSVRPSQVHVGDYRGGLAGYQVVKEQKGNSVLVEVARRPLVFIGHEVFSFRLEPGDRVVRFVSPIGNNDVPYPWVVGATHTYLLIEDAALPNTLLDAKRCPYAQFYGFEDDVSAKALAKQKRPLRGRRVSCPSPLG